MAKTHFIAPSVKKKTRLLFQLTVTEKSPGGKVSKSSDSVAVTVKAVKFKVLKTGQISSYTDFDDGYYQMGAERSYTRDDDKELVIDHVTGLQWQDNIEAKTVTKPWVTQANYDAGRYSDTSGDTAVRYCKNLSLGGYSDWRLPTCKELVTIIDYGRVLPALDPVFLNYTTHSYWTFTDNPSDNSKAYNVWFYHGEFTPKPNKNSIINVRCVRGGK